MPSFGRLGQLFKIPPFSALKLHSAGVIGPRNISLIEILIFLLLAKFRNPMITPSGRKVTGEEGREKNTVNNGHLVSCSTLKPLGPIY